MADRDLQVEPLVHLSPSDWLDPEPTLTGYYRVAEAKALAAIGWYLSRKGRKKRASRLLRAIAIALAAAGGIAPLVSLATPGSGRAAWGYVFLALAATCVGFDRFFGISSGWMRYLTVAQRLQARLERLQFDWSASCAVAVSGKEGLEVLERLSLLKVFTQDIRDVIAHETGEWEREFHLSLVTMDGQLGTNGLDSHDRRRRQPH
jgi:hypothetical protein